MARRRDMAPTGTFTSEIAPSCGRIEAQEKTIPRSRTWRSGSTGDLTEIGASAVSSVPIFAPGSAIITDYLYRRQLDVAGTYKVTSGGNRVRAWKPPRSIHRKMQALIYTRDAGICGICGDTPKFWELDHIKPYRLGGIYIEWNLQVACCGCNASKGAR